jgi:hypothetical protein
MMFILLIFDLFYILFIIGGTLDMATLRKSLFMLSGKLKKIYIYTYIYIYLYIYIRDMCYIVMMIKCSII